MRIPLNVLLYQLSANSIYENQNIDLTCSFDGVQLFDQTQLAGTYERTLSGCGSGAFNCFKQNFRPGFPVKLYVPVYLSG